MATDGGTTTQSDSTEDSSGVADDAFILRVFKTRQWLQNLDFHQKVHTSAAASNEVSNVNENTDQILERIAKLQKQLSEVASEFQLKEHITQWAQLSQALVQILFPQDPLSPELAERAEKISRFLAEQLTLTTEALKNQNEIRDLEKKHQELLEENLKLKCSTRQSMALVEDSQIDRRNHKKRLANEEAIKEAESLMEQEMSKTTIKRCVFQAIIVGSGVNWAKNERLRARMLSLGVPLDKIMEENTDKAAQ